MENMLNQQPRLGFFDSGTFTNNHASATYSARMREHLIYLRLQQSNGQLATMRREYRALQAQALTDTRRQTDQTWRLHLRGKAAAGERMQGTRSRRM
jgi:hypothetical protein